MPIKKKLDNIIKSLGSLSIQDFVELSNFDEEGFYNLEEISKISKEGHFITSPEITPLFGYSLCNQFIKVFKNPNKVHLLELGPGNGSLTKDIYEYLTNLGIRVSQISVLERSSYFKDRITKKFSNKINFLDNLRDLLFNSNETLFIYSNEFFDAISAKQFVFKNKEFHEIKITKENNQYKLIHEGTLFSQILKDFYSEYNFKDGDILEHSNYLLNYLEDLKSKIKSNFFFTTTDYGYKKLPKVSTLRLISDHQPINLFDRFENVDYSFGVNFELISKIFMEFNPVLITQKKLIENFIPRDFKGINDKDTNLAIELLTDKTFFNMGESFNNISFFSK